MRIIYRNTRRKFWRNFNRIAWSNHKVIPGKNLSLIITENFVVLWWNKKTKSRKLNRPLAGFIENFSWNLTTTMGIQSFIPGYSETPGNQKLNPGIRKIPRIFVPGRPGMHTLFWSKPWRNHKEEFMEKSQCEFHEEILRTSLENKWWILVLSTWASGTAILYTPALPVGEIFSLLITSPADNI